MPPWFSAQQNQSGSFVPPFSTGAWIHKSTQRERPALLPWAQQGPGQEPTQELGKDGARHEEQGEASHGSLPSTASSFLEVEKCWSRGRGDTEGGPAEAALTAQAG